MTCKHNAKKMQEPDGSIWCTACNEKIIHRHTRPCRECAHYENQSGICKRHLYTVEPDMYVMFKPDQHVRDLGLCFEENTNT